MKKTFYCIVSIVSFVLLCAQLQAQSANEPKNNPEEWSKPYPPFRIVGNVYYVGTYDLAAYLVVTDKGNILINTGLAGSLAVIKKNIADLGFRFADIKLLLTMQAHFDHVGATAAIKKETGAQLWADAAEADVLQSGGATDYELGSLGISFEPVVPDSLLQDKAVIESGNTKLMMLHHPGHTKGSCSYMLTTADEKRSYRVLIANMPTIITDRKFANVSAYPNIEEDYAYTLQAMKGLEFDIWLAAHASQFNLHKKHKPQDGYHPAAFFDAEGYARALEKLQSEFVKKQKASSK